MKVYIADAFGLDGERICFRFADSMEKAKKMVTDCAASRGLAISLVEAKEYETNLDLMEENSYAVFHDKVPASWVESIDDGEERDEANA